MDDEGLRVVKVQSQGKNGGREILCPLDVTLDEAPAKHVPAAAVIRVAQALFGITGHKECVGGVVSRV